MATLERGFDDATAVLALPDVYRKRLRTTNGVEQLNEEIRRRERVIRIFPNRESAIRLLVCASASAGQIPPSRSRQRMVHHSNRVR